MYIGVAVKTAYVSIYLLYKNCNCFENLFAFYAQSRKTHLFANPTDDHIRDVAFPTLVATSGPNPTQPALQRRATLVVFENAMTTCAPTKGQREKEKSKSIKYGNNRSK